ncbi:hypothetical protein ACF9IK_20185 [Kitasatospora hibisci]|uniref:hypothetical protein n=1 Tax=Kitasatospora hibisci TaxID=3369522 RepID=UPI003754FC62
MATRQRVYVPKVGEVVKDRAIGVEGVYMGQHNGEAHLRPRGGGIEWTTKPASVERVGEKPELIEVQVPSRPRPTTAGDAA